MLAKGESFVVYSIIDFIVDNYFPVLHELEAGGRRAGGRRSSPIAATRPTSSASTELRHELLILRRAVQPLQEVCNRIMRYDVPLIDHAMNDYFARHSGPRDPCRGRHRQSARPAGLGAGSGNLLLVSLAQNQVTKKLTGWAAISTRSRLAIASVYGMNFKNMPELEQPPSATPSR